MDIISRAMKRNLHICKDINIENQTWDSFDKNKKGKKVFAFGIGKGMEYFLRIYHKNVEINGIIDNDKSKHNQELGWYVGEADQTAYSKLRITSPEILNDYCKRDVVVLITSVNFYLPMMKQLRQMGIENIYILLMMEANKKGVLSDDISQDEKEIWNEYVKQRCLQKIIDNKVVMLIGIYGDHARQITKALLNQQKKLDIVWLVNNPYIEKPEGVRLVYTGNRHRYTFEMETARIWLFDDLVPEFIQKRTGQIYIQVKHWSSITLKKFYLDDKTVYMSSDIKSTVKYDGSRMDYLFSGSEFDEISCRSGFMFRGTMIRVGSARSDVLFDSMIRKKIVDVFGLNENAKICMYAPTYRQEEYEKTHSMSITLDLERLLEALKNKWGGEWFILVRIHPSLCFEESVLSKNRHLINAKNYQSSEELVSASDVLVTDYSSIMFESAYIKRPVFLYAPDRKKYIDAERELLIDYNMLPFPIAESNTELGQCIKEFDKKIYERDITEFLDEYGVHEDGHASERAADFIIQLLKP